MPEQIKIILPTEPLSGSELVRLQAELGMTIGELERRIAAGEPILDKLAPHNTEETFIKSTLGIVRALDNLGLDYRAWHNGEPATPQHLLSLLTHKLHVLQMRRGPREPRSRPSIEDD